MKKLTISMLSLLASVALFSGCAPSVSVTPAGNANQFEVTVSSNGFEDLDAQGFLDEWHRQARSTCDGGDYRTITRDFVESSGLQSGSILTGIIECN